MPTRFTHLAYDAADIALLARFWSDLLGWPVTFEAGDEVYVEAPEEDGSAMGIAFVPVPEPKTGKNRMHFDIHTPDIETEATRLVGLSMEMSSPRRACSQRAATRNNE